MKRHHHILLLLLIIGRGVAIGDTIPQGYYSGIQGLKDEQLKTALHEAVGGGDRVHYGTQGYTYPDGIYYTGTWNYFPLTDHRADSTVWDMYSHTKRYFPHDGGSACGLQIEHCVPKSWWGWTSSSNEKTDSIGYRAYRDLYHLNPADAQANNNKSNYPPGHVQKGDKFDNGSFRMDAAKSSKYGWICFEPSAAYRGDFARAYFYIATAYEDIVWSDEYSDYLSNESYLEFQPWLIEVLLDWHRSDPVSIKEIERADAVSDIQHNRNPYIDYPELIEYIWGDKKGQAVDISELVCTQSHDYIPLPDTIDFKAYSADEVTSDGFMAIWSNQQMSYTIDVYTRTRTGKNDTILSMPALTTKGIDSVEHISYVGKLASAGTNAITMGSGSTDGAIVLHDLNLSEEATLVFRASMYQTASAGELEIYLDEGGMASKHIELPSSRDERYYSISIPAGTKTIRIQSIGGSTKKRACMQELYLIQGDLSIEENSIMGYPREASEQDIPARLCRDYIQISTDCTADTVYYRIQREDGRYSNEIAVVLPTTEITIIPSSTQEAASTQKILHKGQIYILRGGVYYTLTGQRVYL